MKVLLVPPPDAGHLTALVQAGWALRSAGHEVLVACQPDLIAIARAAGLNTAEIGLEAQLTEHAARYTSPDTFPAEAFGGPDTEAGKFLWEVTAQTYVQHATSNLQRYLKLARSWGPDLVLTDPFAVIGRVLGGILEIPVVTHRWGVDPTGGDFEVMAARMLTRLLKRHKLDQLPQPVVVLDPCPAQLQAADATPGQPVRFVPYDGTGVLPDWATERTEAHRVVISMGAVVLPLTAGKPVRNALAALASIPGVEVVVCVQPGQSELVGEVGANVRLVESLPLNLIIDSCDLLIHHGGSSQGLTAAAAGIPQLALPQYAEQFEFGARLAGAGAGRTVATAAEQSDVDGLRAVIESLLTEPGYRAAAEQLRKEIESAPALDSVVESIEALAGKHEPALPVD